MEKKMLAKTELAIGIKPPLMGYAIAMHIAIVLPMVYAPLSSLLRWSNIHCKEVTRQTIIVPE